MSSLYCGKDVPEELLKELQTYIDGEVLYIPKASAKKEWGAVSGFRLFYQERNREMQRFFLGGCSINVLMERYGLAYSTIKKIIYG